MLLLNILGGFFMNEIVKYRNELNKVALRNFKSKELDLFIAIISRMRNMEEEVIFSFDYLKNLIHYETSNSIEVFHKELKSMYNNKYNNIHLQNSLV